jgi:hypothetical protein
MSILMTGLAAVSHGSRHKTEGWAVNSRILDHEDMGMMGIVEVVVPAAG